MGTPEGGLLRSVRGPLARADALMNRLYGWRLNPLYHSGVLAVSLLGVVTVTGVYLLFFYRIGAPYQSVGRINQDIFLGEWTRSLHRYASDAAILAALIHMLRIFAQRRSWGPRALAWLSGLVMLFVVLVCGWTGYVMVWDVQGEVLAREGARFLDVLPLFSEPIARAFVGERPIPAAFFFLNLFLHVALPIGLALILWIHLARVARAQLLPPRGLLIGVVGLLSLVSLLWPAMMAPQADAFRLPGKAPYDVFFSFFLPLTMPFPPGVVWLGTGVVSLLLMLVPVLAKPRSEQERAPSTADPRLCTGCQTCYQDCPYDAITMVSRTDGRDTLLAQVDPDLCTSCGICSGSCAPMGVGPEGRTGRNQLTRVREFVESGGLSRGDVVLMVCERSARLLVAGGSVDGSPVYDIECAGNLHTSVIEHLLRSGAAGVLIASCPPRDCWSREGPKWLEQRLFEGREAELPERVDSRRVRVVYAAEQEPGVVLEALDLFRSRVAALDEAAVPAEMAVERECDVAPEERRVVQRWS